MTRQLDPTILRFFTVSRIISPASEMCLCKFHIKIEYFLRHRHHRARRRCLRFGSSLGTGKITSHPPTIIHFPLRRPLLSTHIFKSQLFTVSHICVRIFCDSTTPPEKTPKNSFVPYVPNPILLCAFHYGKVVPEPSSAPQLSLVSYTFLSIYIYVYVLSDFLRFTANVPFIVSYFFIWCFGYPHSRIPYMAWIGFRTAFTDGTESVKCNL